MAKKFSYSNYNSKYQSTIDSLTTKRNQLSTNYNPYEDSAFVLAAAELERRQKYATESARARLNATVGGTGAGTATATAMAQVNNDYISRINDLIPVYKQKALDNIDSQLDLYNQYEKEAYDKYKTERDFAYDKYISERDFKYQKQKDLQESKYQKQKDNQQFEYQKQKDEKEFDYQVKKDAQTYALQLKNYQAKINNSSGLSAVTAKKYKDKYNDVLDSAFEYAKLVWAQEEAKTIPQTFNYIRSLGLSKKETLNMISRLGVRDGKKALTWYSWLGYSWKGN